MSTPTSAPPECVERYLVDDAKTAEGWPNPRAFMTDPVQIARRMFEDVMRLGAELTGPVTTADIILLGWRMDQIFRVERALAATIEALRERKERRGKTMPEDPRPDPRLIGEDAFSGSLTGKSSHHLSSDDIAFGAERAA